MSGTEATQPKQFASLGPMLLARKGSAKPAMRPQLGPIATTSIPGNDAGLGDELADAQNLLGWNDMGDDEVWEQEEDFDNPAASLTPMGSTEPEPSVSRPTPEIRRQQAQLVERIAAEEIAAVKSSKGKSKAGGRRAAFTLRLDQQRHLKLRLASTIAGQSAQKLVTKALDELLDSMPEIDSLAAQVRRD